MKLPGDGPEYVIQSLGLPSSSSFFVLAGAFLAAVSSFFLSADSHSLPFGHFHIKFSVGCQKEAIA